MFLSRRSARFPASAYSARRSHYRPTFEALEERTLLSLSAPIITPTPGTSPAGQPVAGDFNRDGMVDVATIFRLRDGSTSVTVMLGNGDGTFHGGGRVPGRAG